MSKLRDLFSGIAALRDWEKEVERALEVSELNAARSPESYSARKPQNHECLVLDLEAYRASKGKAALRA